MSEHAIVIDLGRRRLAAMQVGKGRSRAAIRVQRAFIEDLPADLDFDDAAALGNWVGERLRHHKIRQGKTTFAVGREFVSLKRLVLPTIDDAELPDMARLAMQRDLPFEPEEVVIDFMQVGRTSTSTTVLAVAASNRVVDHIRSVAKIAGLTIDRISLRAIGAAATENLLDIGPASADSAVDPAIRHNASLLIDINPDTIEFCLAEAGVIQFSRSASVPEPKDRLAIVDAVVTEARRTSMSYRGGGAEDVGEINQVVIMGDYRVAEYAADPLAQMLKLPATVLESHGLVESDPDATPWLDRLWPLAGLMLEARSRAGDTINFANPKRAPDRTAKVRQRRLIAAGVAVVALFGAWTVARQQLKSLESEAADLLAAQQGQASANMRYLRDKYKLEHLQRWESTKEDWLQHATYLTTIAPSPDRMVLDSWFGVIDFDGVKFARDKWSVDRRLRIVIEGEAKDRETADGFRAALVQNAHYETETTGADAKGGKRMPFGFTYRLRNKGTAPVDGLKTSADFGLEILNFGSFGKSRSQEEIL